MLLNLNPDLHIFMDCSHSVIWRGVQWHAEDAAILLKNLCLDMKTENSLFSNLCRTCLHRFYTMYHLLMFSVITCSPMFKKGKPCRKRKAV